jgi:hypothetical protein
VRERIPERADRNCTCHDRRPEAGDEEQPQADQEDCKDRKSDGRLATQYHDALVRDSSSRKQSYEQESDAGRAAGKRKK